jgi:hypothetical protein
MQNVPQNKKVREETLCQERKNKHGYVKLTRDHQAPAFRNTGQLRPLNSI